MSTIPLYNALVKLGLDNDTARDAVDNVAHIKEVATKTDIAELKIQMESLETKLTNKLYAHTGFTIAAVGLMIKFL